MRPILQASILMIVAGCAHTAGYEGDSAAERKLRSESRRDIYPDDVRADLERYRKATLAWPGIDKDVRPDTADPLMTTMVVEHHYWDWMEDHSIQKAKAFLSPRGEGEFVCHVERRTVPPEGIRGAMAIAYVRPVGLKDGQLHAACIVRLHPRDWYATDVFDYGRNGKDLKILRIPME